MGKLRQSVSSSLVDGYGYFVVYRYAAMDVWYIDTVVASKSVAVSRAADLESCNQDGLEVARVAFVLTLYQATHLFGVMEWHRMYDQYAQCILG